MEKSNIKIGIVEDEVLIAEDIRLCLEQLGYQTCEPCISYGQAVEMLDFEKPHLLLIDVQLAGNKSGTDLATKVNLHYHIPFIYITSNTDESTLKLIAETKPSAYFSKPYKSADLNVAIDLALNSKLPSATNVNVSKPSYGFVKKNNLFYRYEFSDVLYLTSDNNYIEMHLKDGTMYLIRKKLVDFMEELNPFIPIKRIHQRHAVNTNYLSAINGNEVLLSIKDSRLPVSKSYREDLLHYFSL